ncbi:MAG: Flp pilus assembly protein CpaB [Negativicutes bacterium]|nr:Flp pilus assembly protein CpaB [Negativicutes bacterium]
MRKINIRLLLTFTLILSVGAAVLTYSHLKKTFRIPDDNLQEVVAARADIPPRTVLTAEMLVVKKYPTAFVDGQFVTDVSQAVGVETREYIRAGQVISRQQLLLRDSYAGFAGVIPPGKRAMSVTVDEAVGLGTWLSPGDFVDVVAVFDRAAAGVDAARTVLRGVEVLAVDQKAVSSVQPVDEGSGKKREGGNVGGRPQVNVVMAVSPQEEAILALAVEQGKIRLALRPYRSELLAGIGSYGLAEVRALLNLPPLSGNNDETGRGGTVPVTGGPPSGTVAQPAAAGNSQPDTGSGHGPVIEVIRGSKVEWVKP